jgi:protoporphyrin/coproporphyrin ferrochelatase
MSRENRKVGVLLTNLGTPDQPTPAALRRYLKEFLSDRRVVDLPRWLWWFILNGIILNTRPKRSAKNYQKIWLEQGSPLLWVSKQQMSLLDGLITERLAGHGIDVFLALGMRYGNPSILSALTQLKQQQVDELIVLPLYPQYCSATTASTLDAVVDAWKQERNILPFNFINNYHDHPYYINALVASIRDHWRVHERGERLIFSFHGIPKRYSEEGDPYYSQCLQSADLVAKSLGLSQQDYLVCFQSRFGKEEWLQPYTDKTLIELAQQGVKRLDICCPGFAADCLETLEEIVQEGAETFCNGGGEQLRYIPALNSSDEHIALMGTLIEDRLYPSSLKT